MENDTYKITDYKIVTEPTYDADANVTGSVDRATVLFDYKVWDKEYSTQMYLDALTGTNTPTADQLSTAIHDWVVGDAKTQLDPSANQISPDLQALIGG